MIVSAKACCASCAAGGRCAGAGMGWGWDDLNPITLAKDVGNSVVSAVGSVATNIAEQVDKTVGLTLGTGLKAAGTAQQLLKPAGADTPVAPVSYTPLVIGGLAAAGLLVWAMLPKKERA